MKYIPEGVTRLVGRQLLVGRKNGPTILLVAGVVGVVATTVIASMATLKVDEVLEETQKDLANIKEVHTLHPNKYVENSYKRDLTVIYARAGMKICRLYAPAVLIGVASIAALSGGHVIMLRRNASLAAAYAAVDRGFSRYRARVIDEFGEAKDREFKYELEDCQVAEDDETGVSIVTTKRPTHPFQRSVYARLFDQLNPNWKKTPEYNWMFIKCQQDFANDLLKSRGHVFLNEVYDMLGIERSKAGQSVGWLMDKNGDNYIDFGVFIRGTRETREFVHGYEGSVILDFNVDGVVLDLIDYQRDK